MHDFADPVQMLCKRNVVPGLLAVAVWWSFAAFAAGAEPLANGPSFTRQLELPLTANWENVSFREVVDGLGKARQIAMVIDRRIDSGEPFSFRCTGDSLSVALKKIAVGKQIGVSILNSVVYFGPEQSAKNLRTLAALRLQEISKLPAGQRRLLTHATAGGWPQLAEPRELVQKLAAAARLRVVNPELIPHDLWPAVKLPDMPWYDRLTLVLVQFGLTFQLRDEGKAIELVPIPEQVQLVKSYPGGADPRARVSKLATLVPAAIVEQESGNVVVTGRDEDHAEIAALLAGRTVRETTIKAGEDRYKLKIDGLPLEKVLTQIGGMLKLELEFDRDAITEADISLDQLISFQVENVGLDELLAAALKETGLKFERNGKQIKITPTARD